MRRLSKLNMERLKAVFVEGCFFLFLKTMSARRPQKLMYKSHTSVIRDVANPISTLAGFVELEVRVFALSQARVPAN